MEAKKMKKIIALVLCVVLLSALSVVAFAAPASPVADKTAKIIVRAADVDGHSADQTFEINVEGETVKVKASTNRGTFNGWSIYKIVNNQPVVAVEEVDFLIVKGDAQSNELEIKAKTDVIICANYNGQKTEPGNFDNGGSPKTADMSVVYVVVAMMAAAAIVFSAKKVYSK